MGKLTPHSSLSPIRDYGHSFYVSLSLPKLKIGATDLKLAVSESGA